MSVVWLNFLSDLLDMMEDDTAGTTVTQMSVVKLKFLCAFRHDGR